MKLQLLREHTLRKFSFIIVVVLLAEGHWEFYCNLTYHFSDYHGCLVHFRFPTSNNSLYLHKWVFPFNCMVPVVLRLIKIVLLITTLYIFLNYYLFEP